jgi:hypothetical protein
MPANARLIAAIVTLVSVIAVVTAGSIANLAGQRHSDEQAANSDAGVTILRAAMRTAWLSPADARRSLEARSRALADWLHARGGSLRVVSSDALLRTRAAGGERLVTAEARLERVIEIRVPRGVELAHARLALLGPDGSIASTGTAPDSRHRTHARPSYPSSDF